MKPKRIIRRPLDGGIVQEGIRIPLQFDASLEMPFEVRFLATRASGEPAPGTFDPETMTVRTGTAHTVWTARETFAGPVTFAVEVLRA